MRKKVNWLRHVGILFLTVIIFSLGIFIGGDIEQLRVQNLYTQLQEQDLDYQTLITESNYIDYLVSQKEMGDEISCNTIIGAYYTSIVNLDDSRIKLEKYINDGSVKTEEFSRLKDHYLNVQVNYWILANKINNLCGEAFFPILYFYADDKTCPECADQGVHLSYVKAKLGDEVLIFSLDFNRAGITQLLGQNYDVFSSGVPVIVIDNKVYTDYMVSNEIFKKLCDAGLENKAVCK